MDSMWLEVILNVKAEEMDALCATLIANGVPGLAVEEEEEFRAFLEENRQYWDYVDDELMELPSVFGTVSTLWPEFSIAPVSCAAMWPVSAATTP